MRCPQRTPEYKQANRYKGLNQAEGWEGRLLTRKDRVTRRNRPLSWVATVLREMAVN